MGTITNIIQQKIYIINENIHIFSCIKINRGKGLCTIFSNNKMSNFHDDIKFVTCS